jgi:hypothetical protein
MDGSYRIIVSERKVEMNNSLNKILDKIESDHGDIIRNDARNYKEVNLSRTASALGLTEAEACFRHVNAIVPLKAPVEGMKVRIDGRTFVNYVQFESGVAVPNYVAEKSGLSHKVYVAQDSMILNFT